MGKGKTEFRRVLSLAVVGILGLTASSRAAVAENTGETGVHGHTPEGYVWPTEKPVLENIERFRDMKLGLMMHFGIYAQCFQ